MQKMEKEMASVAVDETEVSTESVLGSVDTVTVGSNPSTEREQK